MQEQRLSPEHRHLVQTVAVVMVLAAMGLVSLLRHFDAVSTWMRGPDAYKVAVQTRGPDFTWGQPPRHLHDSLGAKGLVLLFVSSTCPCSNAYTNRLVSLMQRYSPQGYPFLWMNEDKVRLLDRHPSEPLQRTLTRLNQEGVQVTTWTDTHDAIAHLYGIRVTPEVVVLDADGYIRYHGQIDDDQDASAAKSHELQDALDDLLAGRDIAVKETKASGCFIVDE